MMAFIDERGLMAKYLWMFTSLLVFSFQPAQAQVYKWVDAKGNVHYSDKKPKGQDADDVSKSLPAPNIDTSHEKLKALENIRLQRLNDEAQENKAKQAKAQKRNNACQDARRYLSRVKGRSYFRYGSGDEKTSETQRAKLVKSAQGRVNRLCK